MNIDQSDEKLKALIAKVHDQEEEIAFLHRQQRDVRFLAKQLAKELQVRLNKRAKGAPGQAGLAYAHDALIEQKLKENNGNRDELLTFIHKRDHMNIHMQGKPFIAALRPLPWKVAAGLFTVSIAVAKKGARKLR